MKIALVISGLGVHGGTEKVFLKLAEDLRDKNENVQLYTFDYKPKKTYKEFSSFRIRACEPLADNSRSGHIINVFRRVKQSWSLLSMVDKDTDIMNIHDHECFWLHVFAKIFRPKMKMVWQINDLHVCFRVGPLHDAKPSWKHPIQRSMMRIAASMADAVTVHVMKNKKRVDKYYRVNSHLYYPGVDMLETCPHPRHFTYPLTLLSTGVLFPYRNYEVIIRAMAVLKMQGIDSRLTVVGSTQHSQDYAESLVALARELQVNMTLAGEISDGELKQQHDESDIFIFPNLDQSWGLASFEAMSASIPSIVSESAGAAELLTGREGACIVDATSPEKVAEAVLDITSSQEEYEKLCIGAFNTVASMTWPNMYCKDMRNLFHQLCSEQVGGNIHVRE